MVCSVAIPALLGPLPAVAQDTTQPAQQAPGSEFSFDLLTDAMRQASEAPFRAPDPLSGPLAELKYDDYRSIRFRPDHARWPGEDQSFHLHAFHLGWLFKEPVHISEVVEGRALPMTFTTEDFDYSDRGVTIPEGFEMPGVAGFRIHTPLNRADIADELIVFQGASYFRALGRDNAYGLSARGLAVNTGDPNGEEFPRFSDFWIERPAPGATALTIYAALESPSVTGAYRFVVTPGETTEIDVTARLFLRQDIAQLGIAPLTSMFLFGPSDPGGFDDFRASVHDSEALILHNRSGETFYRPLNNPPRLASSYLAGENPGWFGLVQRHRGFEDYLDAGAHYERRPSLIVEPVGDWGRGTLRLMEIPSDLEANDNIVAYWIPEAPSHKGESFEFSYRLFWGMNPPGAQAEDRAHVVRTLVGEGGVAGTESRKDRQKFVVDFAGGLLSKLPADAEVEPVVNADRGEITEKTLSRIDGTGTWRLVIEVKGDPGAVVELNAGITGHGRFLTERWLYQWMKE
ncbi:glucan biosynthesis protein [Tropicimonas sp.]|uniref:glucan biosynthesis protein n=1 Tax=Tropicimonas sp. TaxID=2067044 RepID=UPI003A8A380B